MMVVMVRNWKMTTGLVYSSLFLGFCETWLQRFYGYCKTYVNLQSYIKYHEL